jgi:outer membrane protein assembly factor BamB
MRAHTVFRNVSNILAPACVCAGALAAAGQLEGDWPEFRGPARAGAVVGADFPVHFGPGTNVVWAVSAPGGHSSPVIWKGMLFLTGFEQEQLVVLGMNAADGGTRWRREFSPGRIEQGSRLSHPATATPVTDGERLICYFAPFGLVALDLEGRELWRHPLPTPQTQHGASSSPVVASDIVLQLCDQDLDSYLLALDKRTGEVRWKIDRPGFRRGFSTPLPWPREDPAVAIVAGTLRLVAYDGSERWSVRGLPNEMVASPVGDSERIFVAGWTYGSGVRSMPTWESVIKGDANGDGLLTREEAPPGPARQHFAYIDANADGLVTEQEYVTIARIFDSSRNIALAVRPGDATGDITESRVLWTQGRGLPYVPTPLLFEDRLYLVKNGGMVSCLNPTTGEFLYQEERLGAMGDYYSSPVGANGKVLAISQTGTAVVFRAGDVLEILAKNALGEEVLATPAISGKTLYVRSMSRLFAFREE